MAEDHDESKKSGNGNGHRVYVGEPEYFLPALLAADPMLYLVDGEGNLIDAEGTPLDDAATDGVGVPASLRRFQVDAMRTKPPASGDSED
jgi:hypothetical protein